MIKLTKLKTKRLEKKITDEQMAEKLGIKTISDSFYEQGRRKPKPETLKKIALILGCTVDEII